MNRPQSPLRDGLLVTNLPASRLLWLATANVHAQGTALGVRESRAPLNGSAGAGSEHRQASL